MIILFTYNLYSSFALFVSLVLRVYPFLFVSSAVFPLDLSFPLSFCKIQKLYSEVSDSLFCLLQPLVLSQNMMYLCFVEQLGKPNVWDTSKKDQKTE